MTRVDFYQLGRDPVDAALVLLAGKVIDAGERLLIVAEDAAVLDRIEAALWADAGFLPNGRHDAPHAERQPILLSDAPVAVNGAKIVALADGRWRDEALGFSRALLLFDAAATNEARATWRMLQGGEGAEPHIYKQDDTGRWREGG